MIKTQSPQSSYEARSTRDSLKLLGWIMAWMGSLTVSDKAALYDWWSAPWLTIASIVLNGAIGLGVIVYFMRMLRGMDELQRKIQLEALSIALGISLVGCATYSLLVTWGIVVDEEVSDIFVLMTVSYSAGVVLGVVRYR